MARASKRTDDRTQQKSFPAKEKRETSSPTWKGASLARFRATPRERERAPELSLVRGRFIHLLSRWDWTCNRHRLLPVSPFLQRRRSSWKRSALDRGLGPWPGDQGRLVGAKQRSVGSEGRGSGGSPPRWKRPPTRGCEQLEEREGQCSRGQWRAALNSWLPVSVGLRRIRTRALWFRRPCCMLRKSLLRQKRVCLTFFFKMLHCLSTTCVVCLTSAMYLCLPEPGYLVQECAVFCATHPKLFLRGLVSSINPRIFSKISAEILHVVHFMKGCASEARWIEVRKKPLLQSQIGPDLFQLACTVGFFVFAGPSVI